MKVIIAGGRDFDNYELLRERMDYFLQGKTDVEIVSGGAPGADSLGERYAKEQGLMIVRFPANWDLGKAAGPIRNRQMGEYATHLVAFWDGSSRGTANMIATAQELKLPTRVVRYTNKK